MFLHRLLDHHHRTSLKAMSELALALERGQVTSEQVRALIRGVGFAEAPALPGTWQTIFPTEHTLGPSLTWRTLKTEYYCSLQPYSLSELQECAEANKAGTAMWRLVFIEDLGLGNQERILSSRYEGYKPEAVQRGITFLKDDPISLQPTQDSILFAGAWHLLDFKPRFCGLSWFEQAREIAALGPYYHRVEDSVVSQAVIGFAVQHNVNLLDGWRHWGCLEQEDNKRLRLEMGFKGSTLYLALTSEGTSHKNLGAVVFKVPRFSLTFSPR